MPNIHRVTYLPPLDGWVVVSTYPTELHYCPLVGWVDQPRAIRTDQLRTVADGYPELRDILVTMGVYDVLPH